MGLKKRLTAAAAVVVMAASVFFASMLGAGETEDKDMPVTWYGQKETIHFWYSDEALTNFLNSAAVAFGEREGVRVLPELVSENEYLEAINRASLDSGQMPDAYIISHNSLEKAYLAGLAARIQDAAGICNEQNFPAAALSAVTYQEKLVGYPLFFETSALVYNRTYLEEWASQSAMKDLLNAGETEDNPGEQSEGIPIDEELLEVKTEEYFRNALPDTMDDILRIADTFDLPMGVEGIMKWDVSDILYNYWFVGNYMIVGGDVGDDPEHIDINNPETIQCLDVYNYLNQFFYIESDKVNYDSVIQDFCDGKIVFTIATTDVVKKLADAEAEARFGFGYGIAPMPDVSEELEGRSMSVTNVVAINGYSQHKALANRFAAYLTDECADVLYSRTGRVSANLKADADNYDLQVFKKEYADSVPLPKMMETANFWLQLEALFSKVWNGADATELVEELEETIAIQVQ